MARVRSKREAERLAEEEDLRRGRALRILKLAEPGEGYASVGPLLPGQLDICLRCSAIVYGRDRHDEWHDQALTADALDAVSARESYNP